MILCTSCSRHRGGKIHTIKAILIQRAFMQSNKTEMETKKIKLNAVCAALNISASI